MNSEISKKLKNILLFGFIGYALVALIDIFLYYPAWRTIADILVYPTLMFPVIIMALLFMKN